MSPETYENLDGDPQPTVETAVVPEPVEPVIPEAETEVPALEAGEQTEEAREAEHKKKTGSQRAREKADRLERENQALRDALARGTAPKPVEPEATPTKPNPDDPKWKSHQEYEDAKFDYEVETRIAQREAKTKAKTEQETWKQREDAIVGKYEDYQEVFTDFIGAQPSDALKKAILRTPVGPEIVYALGNNPAEIRRLNALDPVDQVLEIGEMASRFKTPPKTEKKPTQAPPPIAPLTGASAHVVKANAGDAYEQY